MPVWKRDSGSPSLEQGEVWVILLVSISWSKVIQDHQLTKHIVQYGLALGARVLGVDAGVEKRKFVESLGAQFLDFSNCRNLAEEVLQITGGGTHAVVVTSGHPRAFQRLADMIRDGGSLCMVGIPPGDVCLDTPIATIVIKGLRIHGNLVGSLEETLKAVEMVRNGKVKPHVQIRPFQELPQVYEMLEKGDISGRIVLQL